MRQEREQRENILLVDVGNTLLGQDLADQTDGRALVEGMNLMGYDAMTIGLRDLDKGREVLLARAAEARFGLTSANLLDAQSREPVLPAYRIVDRGGQRVAIVGLAGPSDLSEATVSALGLLVADPLDSARQTVKQLQGKADAIVVLSRLGEEQDRRLADDVPGITLIVGTGQYWPPEEIWRAPGTGTLVIYAGEQGEYLAALDLVVDGKGKPLSYTWRPIKLTTEFADDPSILDMFDRYGYSGPEASLPAAPASP